MVEGLIGPEDKDFHVEEEEGLVKLTMKINTATGNVWVAVYKIEIFGVANLLQLGVEFRD